MENIHGMLVLRVEALPENHLRRIHVREIVPSMVLARVNRERIEHVSRHFRRADDGVRRHHFFALNAAAVDKHSDIFPTFLLATATPDVSRM
jgi:hypothetical protein